MLFFVYLIGILSYILARDIIKKDLTHAFEKMSYTIFGIIYIGIPSFILPFSLNIELNPVNPVPIFYSIESHGTLTGSFLFLYFIILIWASDIFSYVFGMLFGRNNLIGLVASPKKSWAGYIGGYISSFVLSIIFYLIFDKVFNFINFPFWLYIVFPAISGLLVPIGDLVESVFKRSAQVKDSGDGVPGRGGVLDSVDTILFFLPIYFMLFQIYFALKV